MKVSIDYDGTISRTAVQEYAAELVARGVEVWICTLRMKKDCEDVFRVADEVGILRDRIIFTEGHNKIDFLRDGNFVWHLDDDWIELNLINSGSANIVGVSSVGGNNWKKKCERILYKYKQN